MQTRDQYKKKPPLKYAIGQIRSVPGRPDLNSQQIIDESIAAWKRGVQVIVFHEMAVPGYLLGDKWKSASFALDVDAYNKRIVEALRAYNIVVVFGTLAVDTTKVNEDGTYRKYNAGMVAHKGELLSNKAGLPYAIKALLPNYRIFNDARHFYCLRKLAMEMGVSLNALSQPFSISIDGFTYDISVILCEDMWDIDYVQKPARMHKENGAEVIINLSMSNWSWRKNAKRHQVIKDIIELIGIPFIYVNGAGCQNNGKNFIPFDGSSTVYNAKGDIVFLASMYFEGVLDFVLTPDAPIVAMPVREDVEEMFMATKAATLGFFRTTKPRHRKKVILGLSGGIDSMLTAAFFHHLIESGQLSVEELVLVQMPYKGYNSDETKMLAAIGAKNMNRTLRIVPIDAMVDADAATNGIAEGTAAHKTLQAAMRFQVLKSIAAKEGGLIICNANKTEIAFGYGTLIGDLRGYFAPWMDCVKGEVYQLAVFMNLVIFKREVIPEACIDIAPMDELTKAGKGNRADPFDYGRMVRQGDKRVFVPGYHDAMVRSLTELHKGPEWFLEEYANGTLERSMLLEEGRIDRVLAQLHPDFVGTPLERFIYDLEQKLEWFAAGVHKRVQSVPGAHFSRSSFGWDFWEYLAEVTDEEDELLLVYYPLAYLELKAKLLAA